MCKYSAVKMSSFTLIVFVSLLLAPCPAYGSRKVAYNTKTPDAFREVIKTKEMKNLIVQVESNQVAFWLKELLDKVNGVSSVKIKPADTSIDKKHQQASRLKQEPKDSFEEIDLIRKGKKKAVTLSDFLDEL